MQKLFTGATEAPPPSDKARALLDIVLAKRWSLEARDRDLCAQQIALERRKVSPTPPTAKATAPTVGELLNGMAPAHLVGPALEDGERLHAIIVERRNIRDAVALLENKELQARAVAIAEVTQELGEDWRAIVARRARAVIELIAANRAAQQFRARVRERAGTTPAHLPADRTGGPLFNANVGVGDDAAAFLAEALALGVITRKELNSNAR